MCQRDGRPSSQLVYSHVWTGRGFWSPRRTCKRASRAKATQSVWKSPGTGKDPASDGSGCSNRTKDQTRCASLCLLAKQGWRLIESFFSPPACYERRAVEWFACEYEVINASKVCAWWTLIEETRLADQHQPQIRQKRRDLWWRRFFSQQCSLWGLHKLAVMQGLVSKHCFTKSSVSGQRRLFSPPLSAPTLEPMTRCNMKCWLCAAPKHSIPDGALDAGHSYFNQSSGLTSCWRVCFGPSGSCSNEQTTRSAWRIGCRSTSGE